MTNIFQDARKGIDSAVLLKPLQRSLALGGQWLFCFAWLLGGNLVDVQCECIDQRVARSGGKSACAPPTRIFKELKVIHSLGLVDFPDSSEGQLCSGKIGEDVFDVRALLVASFVS